LFNKTRNAFVLDTVEYAIVLKPDSVGWPGVGTGPGLRKN